MDMAMESSGCVFGSSVCKCISVHFVKSSHVRGDGFAAGADQHAVTLQDVEPFADPGFVATQNFSGADLFVFQKLTFAAGTFDRQHADSIQAQAGEQD
ncbi:hypothetical protein [Desulfonatronum parangueonense]